jgi:hypothetical protein
MKEVAHGLVKKINKILAKSSPSSLVEVLQTLVALLRNRASATNADVELLFQDHSNLMLKMEIIKITSLDIQLV